jgi:hypothetical protein
LGIVHLRAKSDLDRSRQAPRSITNGEGLYRMFSDRVRNNSITPKVERGNLIELLPGGASDSQPGATQISARNMNERT